MALPIYLFVPIHAQRWKKTLGFSQVICNFTAEGREKIHNSLKAIDKYTLSYIMRNYIPNRSIEYNDNRISRFIAQYEQSSLAFFQQSGQIVEQHL
jgi:RNA-directed DNA polymerase